MKLLTILALLLNINCIVLSQGGWIWQNPLPQGNNMSNLQFVNSTTAYTMCFNSVMKSTNAGSNWSIYYTLQEQNNASMHFVNETTGFIVSDTGIVLKTVNGGVNWSVISNFNQMKFHKIYFNDFNTGYALRYNDIYGYSGTSLYRTTNSGLNWNIILNDTNIILRNFNFINSNTGYLCGSGNSAPFTDVYAKIFKTSNSGVTWDSINTRFNCRLSGIIINDANNFTTFGERSLGGARSVYVSTNSGVNWLSSDISHNVYCMEKISLNSWLSATEFSKIYRSTNFGLNWVAVNDNFSGKVFKFVNDQEGLAVGVNGAIARTTNSGVNWNTQYIDYNADGIWGVDFVNSNTGYAADDFHLLKTTNGGNNWNVIFTHGLYHLDFVDANTGYFGGQDSLFKTTNGGLSITQVHYSNAPGVLNEIQFLNSNTGFIMGKYGITRKTIDGGNSWDTISGYGNGYHECLYFYNESMGFIGIEDYNLGWGVSRTTNGGINWDFQNFPSVNSFIFDFYFTNNTTGYFTTRNKIFKTTNSGNNWFSVYSYNNDYYPIEMFAIQFVSNAVGYAAITNGKVLKTTDSGVTWKIFNSITNYGFFDLYFTDNNTGYFVGNGGVILKTTNGCGDPIGIEPISSNIPESFELYQNYPNPFNPVTTMGFSIPPSTNGRNELTTLKIYDILGKEIAVPVNEILTPGEYEITWDARGYPSGVYFYTIEGENFRKSAKMVLIK